MRKCRRGDRSGRWAVLPLVLAVACAASGACDAAARELGPITPLGPLRADVWRAPHEANWQAERLLRQLPQDGRLGAAARKRELRIIRQDAQGRSDRRKLEAEMARGAEVFRELSVPDMALPGYPLDIEGLDRVIGTGAAFVRIGDLLGRAESLVRLCTLAQVPDLAARARGLLRRVTSGQDAVWSSDPNVIATRERLHALDLAIGR